MKNKFYVASSAVLASLTLFACGGGGNTPVTPVSETGIKISLKNPKASFSFGDSISQDDLVVAINYSDGSSKILSNDKYKAYEYNPFEGKRVDIPFPVPLEYSYGSRSKTINIYTTDEAHYSSIKITNIEKDYEFTHGSEGILKVKYESAGTVILSNPLYFGYGNIEYKSSNENSFSVATNGDVTANLAPGAFKGATISAYIDNIKVDDYTLTGFVDDVYVGIDLSTNKAKCADEFKGKKFESEKLTFPSIVNNGLVINEIDDNGFIDCINIKELELPGTITKIGENAFSGCTALDNNNRTLDIPYTVKRIAPNAFLGTKIQNVWFEDPYDWCYTYRDEETREYKYGNIDPEYLSNTTIAAKILTREDLCGATFLKF